MRHEKHQKQQKKHKIMIKKITLVIGILMVASSIQLNAQEQTKPKSQKETSMYIPKISGFVQGLYQLDASDRQVADNTFRMRRVRMSVDGKLGSRVSYKIQGDWVSSPILVDAYVKVDICKGFALQAGQFKTPFTMESPINPVNLEIFDYGETVKHLSGYDDVCGVGKVGRDIGVMATGKLFSVGEGKYDVLEYNIGVFNGNGVNIIDNNNEKDFIGRINVHPGLKAITLSASGYYGTYFKDEIQNGKRMRYSFGGQYDDGRLMLRAEYVDGETGSQVIDTLQLATNEHLLHSQGYYAVLGYGFHFGSDEHQQTLMPVLRYEHYAKDASLAEGGKSYFTAGINYWPLKNLNFKLDYSLIRTDSGENSHRLAALLSYKF